jgi:transposase
VKIHGTGVPGGTSTYSPRFRADAIALYRSRPGRTIASVTTDLGINHQILRIWVRQAEQPGPAQTSALEKENRQLRARVSELKLEREIPRRTATYLAGQTHWPAACPSSPATGASWASSGVCRVLEVSRSGSYRWVAAAPARRARKTKDARLTARIRALHTASGRR